MKNNRTRAFTLTEMIVVMLLSAVVVGMTYAVFRIVSQSYAGFTAKNERVNAAEQLEHWLGRDMQRADAVLAGGHVVRMLISRDTVSYLFRDSLVERIGPRIDSFHLATKGLACYFNGNVLREDSLRPADKVQFDLWLEKQQIPETFFKLYSAEQLIQLDHAIDRYQQHQDR